MAQANYADLKAKLVAERAELLATASTNATAAAPVELDQSRVGRLSRMDAMQAQAMSLATQQRATQRLARISSALQRIDDGEFGDCVRCGEPIGEARISYDPSVLLCIECANAAEN